MEPWAAYWELRARLDQASTAEIQEFLTQYAGTYAEDRLRNDWLLQLGRQRDWATVAQEYPRFRMNDDREVRCYALGTDANLQKPETAAELKKLWYALREADDGEEGMLPTRPNRPWTEVPASFDYKIYTQAFDEVVYSFARKSLFNHPVMGAILRSWQACWPV